MKISVRLSVFLSNLFEANWLRNAESAAHFVAVSENQSTAIVVNLYFLWGKAIKLMDEAEKFNCWP